VRRLAMLVTVPGIYHNGVVTLKEIPLGITHSQVLVTLIPDEDTLNILGVLAVSEPSFSEWDNEVDEIYDRI
jgi:hypothetical protein